MRLCGLPCCAVRLDPTGAQRRLRFCSVFFVLSSSSRSLLPVSGHSVKLKAFSKFEDTTSALAAASAICDGSLDKSLKKFLKKNMDDASVCPPLLPFLVALRTSHDQPWLHRASWPSPTPSWAV